jgi:integrase
MPKGLKKAFTEVGLDKMAAPRGGRREIGDAVQPGLVLRVSETGVKSWSVIYKVPGERGVSRTGRPLKGAQRRITLGQYPLVGLEEARDEARRIIKQALSGQDPRPERRDNNLLRHTNSVEAVSKRMIELAKRQVESWPKIEQVLTDYVWPTLGSRPIADVTQADIHRLLDELVAQDRHGTAREVRKMMSRLLNYAAEKSLIPASPMAGMKRRDLTLVSSDRVLADDEIRAVWAATGDMAYPFGTLIRALLLTGQRRQDWEDARWSEIDAAERWLSIPKERYKVRTRGHIVPLIGPAWALVEGLPRWNGKDPYLFSTTAGEKPSELGTNPLRKFRALTLKHLRRLRDDPEAELEHFTPHDFRRTAETRMARLGFNLEVRNAVTGHAQDGLQRTYNKHDYLAEKRAALEAYGAHILGLVK